MAFTPSVFPVVDSKAVFKDDIFKGKVLFCTGGGSGICKGMTEAVVRMLSFGTRIGLTAALDAPRCRRRDCWPEVSSVATPIATFRLV
jgi:hypothetical protein